MDDLTLIALFCELDDLANQQKLGDSREIMSCAEVALTGIVASLWFGGNLSRSRQYLMNGRYVMNMLSESRLCRRLHHLPELFWRGLFRHQGSNIYVVDSFPVASCHPIRSFVSKLFPGEQFRGYNSSKKEWFFGLKVHVVAEEGCNIVDFIISPASEHDLNGLKVMDPKLPPGSMLYGDKAYTDYNYEDRLRLERRITLVAERKTNAKRSHPKHIEENRKKIKKRIESLFSDILKRFPRFLKAVTEAGFELKLSMFLAAQSLYQRLCAN